jgi:hypothetical protein
MGKKPQNPTNQNEEKIEKEPEFTEESSAPEEDNSESSPVSSTDEPSTEPVIEDSVPVSENVIPEKLQMLKNFRIEMPLPGRSDVFLSLALKKDQEITDKRIIKQLLKSDALFSII